MAGNPEHEDALRKAYPGATEAECDGAPNQSATLTYSDGSRAAGKCPACVRDDLARNLSEFIPPRFHAPISVPQKVADWTGRGGKAQGLYLAGQVGTGKTHTAWAATCRWCMAAGVNPCSRPGAVIFTRLTDLLDDLRPGDGARQRVRDCQNAQLLIIDDIGAEKPSEWTQERLYSVIDHRYANCLPLIVTSNLPPRELAGQTGERVASRLAEMCKDMVVPMTGADRRRPAA